MNTALAAMLAVSATGPRFEHDVRAVERRLPAAVWRTGRASWYGDCQPLASGGRYDPDGLICAHRSLPFGTRLEVRWRGRVVQVIVNDRGPFVRGRVLDLSRGAARQLGMLEAGVATVRWRVLP